MCKIDLIRLQLQNSTAPGAKKVSLKFGLILTIALLFFQTAFAQNAREAWIDSVFQTLNTEEKIGQLIMVRVPSNSEEDQENLIDKIRSHRIGGAIIMKGGPISHARFLNKIQETARVPMLIGMETTGGVGQVIDSVLMFPSPNILSAVKNDSLVNAVHAEQLVQMKLLGFDFNFPQTEFERVNIVDATTLTPVVLKKPKGGETEVRAFLNGTDIFIEPKSISAFARKIKKDMKKDVQLQQKLDETVRRILGTKYDAGLSELKPVNTENLFLKLNPLHARLLHREVIRKSITLVENKEDLLPIGSLENKRFASISIGKGKKNEFTHTLSKYAPFDHYELEAIDWDIVNRYDYVAIGVYSGDVNPVIEKLHAPKKIVVHFGDAANAGDAIVAAYAANPISESSAAQMIFGAMPFSSNGISTTAIQRFSYVVPEEAGMDSKTLEQIGHIIQQAIDSGATPGAHVLVAHKGKVAFDKSFGWYTYDKKVAVSDETLYDLASITKVAATLQAVMFLAEKGMIDVYKKASLYLPDLRNTNKKDITIKDMLTHQSGLLPFIPMWPNTVKDNVMMPHYYGSSKSDQYSLQVAPELFVSPVIRDSAWHWALSSKMTDRTARTPYSYRYSDMGSMIFHHLVENVINQPMDEFLQDHFYEPLGAATLGFRPLERFDPSRIAPTEIDTIYRKQLVHGTVHDERAAMLGGIAGHAGLFGNANDLGKVGQMLLNGGTYGGVRYYKKETVDLFTSKQYDNSRRGLGWDKPTVGDWNGPTTPLASAKTFGHTGFTGTCIWVDPEFDLVFIFLSNRVWPDRNNKLLNANIRPRIQEVVYKAIFNYCQFQE